MQYNLLDSYGYIDNKDIILSRLRSQKKLKAYTEKQLCFKINANAKVAHLFDRNFVEVVTDEQAQYMWISSGLVDDNGDNLYFHFSKSGTGWKGALVGTKDVIIETQSKSVGPISVKWLPKTGENICSNTSKENSTKISSKKPMDNELFEDLLENLLFKEKWTVRNMKFYVNNLLQRLNYFVQNKIDISEYVSYSMDKEFVLFNTGLLDKFGNTVNIISRVLHRGDFSYTDLKLVKCKTTLLNHNFSRETINKELNPVRFWDENPSELIFDANIDDFDLSGWDRLEHCIEERKDRYPIEMQGLSSDVLCRDLVNAIEIGIKLSKYDTNYVLPTYNMNYNSLHFIIPYHLNNDFSKKPELGIVVTKTETFWQILTILDRQQCEDSVFFLSLYTDTCFSER